MVKTVAIIGAGLSGLAGIKSCLEDNLTPVCFEYFDTIGGTWILTERYVEGQGAAVYNGMRLNTSQHMSCYSDYPFPDDCERYMDLHAMRKYLQSYASHFDLMRYIRFNCDVTDVRPTSDHDLTGRWSVTYTQRGEKHTTVEFDAVMVCSGRQRIAKYPSYPGQENFRGKTMHSIHYRTPDEFKDKVVLVVGNGTSGCDIATEATTRAKLVNFSIGNGFWINPREHDPKKRPLDQLSRFVTSLPVSIVNRFIEKRLTANIDHRTHGLVPEDNRGPAYSLLVVNDNITQHVKTGKVVIKHHIERITENGVVFKDGTELNGIDIIVYATGYKLVCKFLSPDILSQTLDKMSLYRLILPTSLAHPTLCLVGCLSIRAAVACCYESQARWAVALWTNRFTLPSVEVMLSEVRDRKRELVELYGRLKYWLVNIKYHDELARDLALFPSFWRTFFTRPLEYIQFYLQPAYPMTLRLYGRHAWPGARDAIDKALRT